MLCTCCAPAAHLLCTAVGMVCTAVGMVCTRCAHAVNHSRDALAMPRLPGSGHATRWQPRQFMGTGMQGMHGVQGMQGVQGEVGEGHERLEAGAKAAAVPLRRRREARRGAARHSRRAYAAPAPPALPAPLAPPALQGCSARGSCGRVGATRPRGRMRTDAGRPTPLSGGAV